MKNFLVFLIFYTIAFVAIQIIFHPIWFWGDMIQWIAASLFGNRCAYYLGFGSGDK